MSSAVPLTRGSITKRVALLTIVAVIAIALIVSLVPGSTQYARADTGTSTTAIVSLTTSSAPAAKTVTAAKKKANPNDPAYVQDARNACKGMKYVDRHRMKHGGKTYSWFYTYKSKKKTPKAKQKLCFVNLASHRTRGKKVFRDVYVKVGKKVVASDSGKFKVEADTKVKRNPDGSFHVFADTRIPGSTKYVKFDFVLAG